MSVPKSFLCSGATVSFQVEGVFYEVGNALSTHDFETDGNLKKPLCVTYKISDETIVVAF